VSDAALNVPGAHAQIAKGRLALRAEISGQIATMNFAIQLAHHWRLWQRLCRSRRSSILQVDFTDLNELARLQLGFVHQNMTHLDAVGRSQVFNGYCGIRDEEHAVGARDGGIIQDDIITVVAAQRDFGRLEGNFPSHFRTRIDDEASHEIGA
jgi:hypothetical protein